MSETRVKEYYCDTCGGRIGRTLEHACFICEAQLCSRDCCKALLCTATGTVATFSDTDCLGSIKLCRSCRNKYQDRAYERAVDAFCSALREYKEEEEKNGG